MPRQKKTTVEKKTQTTAPAKTTPVAEEKKAEAAAAETKVEEVKAEEVKTEEVKAEKEVQAVAAKKEEKPARKAPAKRQVKKAPAEIVEEVFVEHNHEQFLIGDIVNRIKETYKSEGHRISSIKSLKVYVDPAQRKAYYVINEKAEGKSVDL